MQDLPAQECKDDLKYLDVGVHHVMKRFFQPSVRLLLPCRCEGIQKHCIIWITEQLLGFPSACADLLLWS